MTSYNRTVTRRTIDTAPSTRLSAC